MYITKTNYYLSRNKMSRTLKDMLLQRWNKVKHWSPERLIKMRHELVNDLDGKVMVPLCRWPKYIRKLIFQRTALGDTETFKLLLFFLGNGFSPMLAADFVLSSYALDRRQDYQRRILKRIEQLNWINKNKENHPEWTYFDLMKCKILHLSGNVYTYDYICI